jgi:fructokinase
MAAPLMGSTGIDLPGPAPMVVAGEALVDRIETGEGELQSRPGGSPYNLALALARLGRRVQYRSPLSSDAFGQRLAGTLRDSGVVLTGGSSALPTSLAIVRFDPAGQPLYRFQRDGVADRSLAPMSVLDDWPAQARFFHVGSLALIPPDGEQWCALLAALRNRGVATSVDINMRPAVAADAAAYARTARAVAAQANWLKLSDEDLLSMELGGDPLQAARGLFGAATRAVLLTLGAQGAWCLTRDQEIFHPAPEVEVVDTVGAGDCFYAGFLASLDELHALSSPPSVAQLRQAMEMGKRAAAFNLQRRGCQPPWMRDLAGL